MLKKFPLLLLTIIVMLTLSLAGCGSNPSAGSKDSSGGGQKASGSTSSGSSAKSTSSPKAVTINFWMNKFEDYQTAWFKKWVKKFNDTHPDINVKLTVVPGDVWDQKMKAAQAAGNAPDVWTVNYNKIAVYAQQGQIKAMDPYVNPKIWDDLYDNVKSFVTVKGKHYAYPQLVEPSSLLYYRKDLFQKAGLDPNKPPKTFAELIADGKKLKSKSVYGLHIANNAVEYSWTTWGLQMHDGTRIISPDWSKATLGQNELDIIKFYKEVYASKIAPAQALSGYTDLKDFGEGKVAMAICGSWGIGQLRTDYPKMVKNVGVAVMPSPDGDATKTTATLGGWTLAIDGNSKNPKQAADFISWLYAGDPKIMADFFKTSKYSKFAARKSVDALLNQDPQAKNDPVRKLISTQIVPHAVAEPIYPWQISKAFGDAIERAVKGQDPQKSMDQATKEINDYIKKNNVAGTNPKK